MTLGGDGFASAWSGRLRNQAFRVLRKGESVVSYTVMEAAGSPTASFDAVQIGSDGRVVVGTGPQAAVVDWDLTVAGQANTSGQNAGSGSEGPVVEIRPAPGTWDTAWTYDGFLMPARITGSICDGIVDFGRVVTLAEIRAGGGGSPLWAPGRLPADIEVAVEPGRWTPGKGERQWRAGVRTGNYGEVHPEPETDETLMLPSVPARYVRADRPADLLFFTDSKREARHALRVETGDFLKNGTRQTLVATDIFAQFVRPVRGEDPSVALLDAQGRALFRLEPKGPVQGFRLLDWKGTGVPYLFVVYASGLIESYDLAGKLAGSADLYRMQADYDRTYNHVHTRQPAGGFAMPFSIGLWRPDASGARRIVIGRYGAFSFLNPDMTFEGLLMSSGYAIPGLLAEGADFKGGGREEQLAAESQRLWPLGGSGTPDIRDPMGAQDWPQVYQVLKTINTPSDTAVPLSGYPIVRYERLDGLAAAPRYVLLARGSSVCLYDAREMKIGSSWSSQAPLTGVGVVEQKAGHLCLLAATADGLLWRLDWNRGMDAGPAVEARAFPDAVASIREIEGTPGSAVLAGAHGVYLCGGDGTVVKVAEGDFTSAWPLDVRDGRVTSIVATTRRGEVVDLTQSR